MAAKKDAEKVVRLTHPNGTVVGVREEKGAALTASGFTAVKATSKSADKS